MANDDFSGAPAAGSVQSCPKDKPKHWLAIELCDEDGQPIAHEAYEVKLPNGSTVSGFLDDKGRERLEPIEDAGSCQVSFPKLDGGDWQAGTSAPPRAGG